MSNRSSYVRGIRKLDDQQLERLEDAQRLQRRNLGDSDR
jgi:hypothetical protein